MDRKIHSFEQSPRLIKCSVAGGFLAAAKGWRWVFWLLVIISGFLSLVFPIFMRETYAPVILEKKVRRLRKERGNGLLRSKLDIGLSPRDYFNRGIVRPFKMLAFSPIVIIFALYMAVVYGYLYLMFTSMTYVFTQVRPERMVRSWTLTDTA